MPVEIQRREPTAPPPVDALVITDACFPQSRARLTVKTPGNGEEGQEHTLVMKLGLNSGPTGSVLHMDRASVEALRDLCNQVLQGDA